MEKIRLFADGAIAVGASLFAFLYGDVNVLFYSLLAFMALDYITGLIAAFINKEISSEIGLKGILKKFFILIIIAISHIIDAYILMTYPVLQSCIIIYFAANESISIVENAAKLGIPIPIKLLDALKQLKKQGEGETEQDKEDDETEGDDK